MKWFSRQSLWHGVCLLSERGPRLASGRQGGVIRSSDWLAAVDEAGSFQLRLSRLAKRWRCCCVQVKGTSDKKTENIYPGRKGGLRWKRGSLWMRLNPKIEVFNSIRRNTFGVLEESAVVSTIVWLPGTLCTASNLDSCVFSSHQQRMKAFKRGERYSARVFFFFLYLRRARLSHTYTKCLVWEPCASALLILPGMRGFCWEQMQRVFVFKFGGTASQLVISGGRHGVHLAERHAGGCAFLPASFVRSRWLIYRLNVTLCAICVAFFKCRARLSFYSWQIEPLWKKVVRFFNLVLTARFKSWALKPPVEEFCALFLSNFITRLPIKKASSFIIALI